MDLMYNLPDLSIQHLMDNKSNASVATNMAGDDDMLKKDIVQPYHYSRYVIEPLDFIMENQLPFWVGSIIKYACRAGYKLNHENENRLEAEIRDLRKIIRYCEVRMSWLDQRLKR